MRGSGWSAEKALELAASRAPRPWRTCWSGRRPGERARANGHVRAEAAKQGVGEGGRAGGDAARVGGIRSERHQADGVRASVEKLLERAASERARSWGGHPSERGEACRVGGIRASAIKEGARSCHSRIPSDRETKELDAAADCPPRTSPTRLLTRVHSGFARRYEDFPKIRPSDLKAAVTADPELRACIGSLFKV